jgi:hypothetical protein
LRLTVTFCSAGGAGTFTLVHSSIMVGADAGADAGADWAATLANSTPTPTLMRRPKCCKNPPMSRMSSPVGRAVQVAPPAIPATGGRPVNSWRPRRAAARRA